MARRLGATLNDGRLVRGGGGGGGGDPMLPPYKRPRDERRRPPKPMFYKGKMYDVMGGNDQGQLVLRDERAIHRDVRVEKLAGSKVIFDNVRWKVARIEVTSGPVDAVLHLVDAEDRSRTLIVTGSDVMRVQFLGVRGRHVLGQARHDIIRMQPVVSNDTIRIPVQPGNRFEARLRGRELEGLYTIQAHDNGRLVATGLDRYRILRCISISSSDIAPRYEQIASPDYGANFDVDAFLFREDQLRGRATDVGAGDPGSGPVQDPLLGRLCCPEAASAAAAVPRLRNGAAHLQYFERFIRRHLRPDEAAKERNPNGVVPPRRLTVLNLEMINQGGARGVLDALVAFRHYNPDAEISIVVARLGPGGAERTPEFHKRLAILEDNDFRINLFTAAVEGSTRQIMHGKGIVIDDHVLFSTGPVIDSWPINKADLSIELPPAAAVAFRRYVDETIHGEATLQRRIELSNELSMQGVVINDPISGQIFITRAQDALIRGATRELILSVSELTDPSLTRALIRRAMTGLKVILQVRQLDAVSKKLLSDAESRSCASLWVEETSTWEPRPHFNAIVADGVVAYVGTAYLWQTQRSMLHHGRSFENGVLVDGEGAARVRMEIVKLRALAMKHGSASGEVEVGVGECVMQELLVRRVLRYKSRLEKRMRHISLV